MTLDPPSRVYNVILRPSTTSPSFIPFAGHRACGIISGQRESGNVVIVPNYRAVLYAWLYAGISASNPAVVDVAVLGMVA